MAVLTINNVSVFTVGGTAHVTNLDEASLSLENDQDDVAGASDVFPYDLPLHYDWSIDATLFPAPAATMSALAVSTDPQVAITFTYGSSSYVGTAIIEEVVHDVVGGAQRQRCRFACNSALSHS